VPGDGQSVLKVTLPNGKQNVYLQKQPGAGWYEMGPDGTVNENSDAVKSNHAVQQKLAGQGQPGGQVRTAAPAARGCQVHGGPGADLHEQPGGWTPDPHQSVVALTSFPGDT
jgi:hypothetical protein